MPGWQPSKLRKAIPRGKTRIIGIDLFAFEEYLVKDCDTPAEAIEIADRKNESRKMAAAAAIGFVIFCWPSTPPVTMTGDMPPISPQMCFPGPALLALVVQALTNPRPKPIQDSPG
jgi:hypothetical protein